MKNSRYPARALAVLFCTLCLLLQACGTETSFDSVFSAGLSRYSRLFNELGLQESEKQEDVSRKPLITAAPSVEQTVRADSSFAPDEGIDSGSSDLPLYMEYSYYLPSLTGDEWENFLALYRGILTFEETIRLPIGISSQESGDLMTLLHNECPELLQLDDSWTEHSNLLGNVVSISPGYCLDPTAYRLQLSEINALLSQWQQGLAGKTAFEAELFIYDYIIRNCQYSVSAPYCQSAYGALIAGKAKCDGRAKAMTWALRSLGITGSVLTGSNHAWVTVRIDGNDYNTDPTYDDNESDNTQQQTSYAYFNVPQSAIASDPYPVDDFFIRRGYPQTTCWDANYHVQMGQWIAAGENAAADAEAVFETQMQIARANGSGLINLRFESAEDYKAAADAQDEWIQSFLNRYVTGCNITSYDFSKDLMLTMFITFR